LQPFDLREQGLKPAPQRRGHGGRGFPRRGAKPDDLSVEPGKIKPIALGKTCLSPG